MADYYKTLGIDKNATQEEIKRAYRRLAHQYHPDKDGGDEEKFKEVNEAYQTLNDESKRSQYDRFGQAYSQGYSTGGFPGDGPSGFEDIGSIFEQFFGGSRTRSGPEVRRGRDVGVDVTITFEEAASGLHQDISHQLNQACDTCQGSGAEPNTPIEQCQTCQGSGVVNTTRQTMLGVFTQQARCSACQGEGKKAKEPCRACRGEGRRLKSRTLEIDIPAGISDGQTIRIQGKGEAPIRGGISGDLFVTVHVKPHPSLTRVGHDIKSTVKISFVDATLGTKTQVGTLEGLKQIDIKPGTQPQTEIKLTGLGFPRLREGGRGDHIITVVIEIPKKLSKKQHQILEEYRGAKAKRGLFR